MSVVERKIVDLVSINKAGTRVTLTISDHLEWPADNEHFLILQEKINDYIMFIETGELYENFPDSKSLDVCIDVVCQHTPSKDALHFFSLVEQTLQKAGIIFSHRIFDSNATEQGIAANP